jgi:phosphatidylglycerophosphatase A
VACGFGMGLFKYAPGTVATIVVGVPFYLSISHFSLIPYLLIISLAFLLGIYICGIAEQQCNRLDDARIVWDEICGYAITMIYIPNHAVWIILGVLLFRLFDILKPWPIYYVDQYVKGGLGIMLDDLLAAGYANLTLHTLIYLSQ